MKNVLILLITVIINFSLLVSAQAQSAHNLVRQGYLDIEQLKDIFISENGLVARTDKGFSSISVTSTGSMAISATLPHSNISTYAVDGNLLGFVEFYGDTVRLFSVVMNGEIIPRAVIMPEYNMGPRDIAISGNYLYLLAYYRDDKLYHMRTYDISNPDDPQLLDNQPAEVLSDLYASGNWLVGNTREMLYIYQLGDPAQPQLAAALETPWTHSYADYIIDGDYLYVSAETGFGIVDLANPAGPLICAFLDEKLHFGFGKSGNIIYMSLIPYQLAMIDVSNPYNPQIVQALEFPFYIMGVRCYNGLIYLRTIPGLFAFRDYTGSSPVPTDVPGRTPAPIGGPTCGVQGTFLYTISGYTYDTRTGHPLGGVTIDVQIDRDHIRTYTSDINGYYAADIPFPCREVPRDYKILVSKYNYVDQGRIGSFNTDLILNFSLTPHADPPYYRKTGEFWIDPFITSVSLGDSFAIEFHANSQQQSLAYFFITINFYPSICNINENYGSFGVVPGSAGFPLSISRDNNSLDISGFDPAGIGPSRDLHLATVHWTATGTTDGHTFHCDILRVNDISGSDPALFPNFKRPRIIITEGAPLVVTPTPSPDTPAVPTPASNNRYTLTVNGAAILEPPDASVNGVTTLEYTAGTRVNIKPIDPILLPCGSDCAQPKFCGFSGDTVYEDLFDYFIIMNSNKSITLHICNFLPGRTVPPLQPLIAGDVNHDSNVNIIDALMTAQYYVRLISNADLDLTAADVNCDGKVDIVDALQIAQYYVGVISEFTDFCI